MTEIRAAALLKNISALERALTTLGFIAMTLILFADVVARELTHSGLITARQYGVYANIVVVMFGLGIASANDAHLRPRFVDNLMTSQFKAATEKLRQATTALFAWACAWLCAWITLESYQLYEVSALTNMPIAPFMAVMPCAFTLMAIRHSFYTVWPALAHTEILPSEPAPHSADRA
jgi:TRAP-type C4-dicarboxylate transport system permease small subunit